MKKNKEVEEGIELSINAMTRDYNHNTIRIKGKIKNKDVSVLIDTGSSSSSIEIGFG